PAEPSGSRSFPSYAPVSSRRSTAVAYQLLDARQVSAFDDAALPALTAGRSRAKYLRRRLVVLDGDGGAVSASLRRSGLRFRFPVYTDASAAQEGLAAERADLAAHSFGWTAVSEPRQPAV